MYTQSMQQSQPFDPATTMNAVQFTKPAVDQKSAKLFILGDNQYAVFSDTLVNGDSSALPFDDPGSFIGAMRDYAHDHNIPVVEVPLRASTLTEVATSTQYDGDGTFEATGQPHTGALCFLSGLAGFLIGWLIGRSKLF